MVASRQVEIPNEGGIGRQRGRRFAALAQVNGRRSFPFLRKYVAPAAKRADGDLVEFGAPKIAKVVSGRKSFKNATKKMRRQTLIKQLGTGSEQKSVIPTKSSKQVSWSRRNNFTNISR